MSIHENSDVRVPINSDSVSIVRDDSKCILCGSCRSTCKFSQGVYGHYDLEKTNDRAICIDCGQCSNVCPTGAITEVMDYIRVKKLVKDPNYVVIFQTAPAVRVSLGEEFKLEAGTIVEGKLVSALKKLGASYVLDTAYGADLTIMEEANELIERIQNKGVTPMFTSCCPAWVKFIELFYPKYIPNLSSCKSPILMQGAICKTYFAAKMNIDPSRIINVAITPCTAKKAEIKRSEMDGSGRYLSEEIRDMDYIVTVRELARWMREENIDFDSLEDSSYDSLLGKSSGAGVIFGSTGGVMEAAIRTAHFYVTGRPLDNLILTDVRGLDGIKETNVTIGDYHLKLAVVTGTNNAHQFFEKLENGEVSYDFVEGMACIGGCIAGGGQPKVDQTVAHLEKEKRMNSLYHLDSKREKRNSYENPEIKELYDTFLREPGSEISEVLLHTSYESKCHLLNQNS
jgi:ferredoxin hydrogenase